MKKLTLYYLKDDKKYASNEEIVKVSNRFRPLSSEEESEEMSDKDISYEFIR